MGPVDLTIDQLSLDSDNPRIDSAANQREALQKIISDEPAKFVRLVKSIRKRGLNPMDRFLVIRPTGERTYTVLEGNRRAAALLVLSNPTSLGSLAIDKSVRKQLEDAATGFLPEKIEPIAGFDVGSREKARTWLRLRHTGENKGEGVVAWKPTAQARFLGGEPALEALEFVKAYGGLSDAELAKIDRRPKLTTLQRLIESRSVREKIGIEVINGVIHSRLPAEELIKPLRQFVVDIAEGSINSRNLATVKDQVDYIGRLPRDSRPKLSTAGALRPISEIAPSKGATGKTSTRPKPTTDPSDRPYVIPKEPRLNVTDPKIADIVSELRKLRVGTYPNAISVLLRVFLELSTDHYMTTKGLPIDIKVPNRGSVRKKLRNRVNEVIKHLIDAGARANDFNGIRRALGDIHSPLSITLLNDYIHNRFVIPKERDLLAAWDEARPYFEAIWR